MSWILLNMQFGILTASDNKRTNYSPMVCPTIFMTFRRNMGWRTVVNNILSAKYLILFCHMLFTKLSIVFDVSKIFDAVVLN